MKNSYRIFKKTLLVCVMLLGVSVHGFAQWDISKMDLKVDWQMNAPFSTDFADKISGWGMNYELTYGITPRWEAGVCLRRSIPTISMWDGRPCIFHRLRR